MLKFYYFLWLILPIYLLLRYKYLLLKSYKSYFTIQLIKYAKFPCVSYKNTLINFAADNWNVSYMVAYKLWFIYWKLQYLFWICRKYWFWFFTQNNYCAFFKKNVFNLDIDLEFCSLIHSNLLIFISTFNSFTIKTWLSRKVR